MNPGLKVSGIALTMYDSQTKLSLEVVHELNSFIEAAAGKALPWADAKVFRSKIRRNIKLAESPSFGQTILKYDSASHGATDYRALAQEVMEMEGGTPAGSIPVPVTALRREETSAAKVTVAPVPVVTVSAAIDPKKLATAQLKPIVRATAVPKRKKPVEPPVSAQ